MEEKTMSKDIRSQQTSIASNGSVGLPHDKCPASVPQQQKLTYESKKHRTLLLCLFL